MSDQRTKWTAIVVTCTDEASAEPLQYELEVRQKKGYIDKDVLLLTVEDPQTRVGSGGATLNALLVVSEHLSQRHGYTVVTSDVLLYSYILILHVGRSFCFDSCGRAFVTLPVRHASKGEAGYEGLVTNIDHLICTVTDKLSTGCPPGVWVCSTDMFLTVPTPPKMDWAGFEGACVISVPATQEYARNHGIYRIDKDGVIQDIFFRGGPTAMKMCALRDGTGDPSDHMVSLVAGVVFLSSRAAEKFLFLHALPGLDACTYLGMDSDVKPIELSLFFDILLCLAKDVTKEEFVSGEKGKPYNMAYNKKEHEQGIVRNARAQMWNKLRGLPMKAMMIPDGSHNYLTMSPKEHLKYRLSCPLHMDEDKQFTWANTVHSFIQGTCDVEESAVITNCTLEGHVTIGPKCAISHCHLQGDIDIPKESVLININSDASKALQQHSLSAGIFLQAFHVRVGGSQKRACKVYTVMGRFDSFETPYVKGTSTFCNSPWIVFLTRTGIDREDLWPTNQTDYDRTLFNAKLFPVWNLREDVGIAETLWLEGGGQDAGMLARWRLSWRLSFEDILSCVNLSAEFAWRRELFYGMGRHRVKDVLLAGDNQILMPFLRSAAVEGYAVQILETVDQGICESNSPSIAARGLAFIANILAAMADGKGGLRSGPAANPAWKSAYQLLEEGKLCEGMRALTKERSNWLGRPDKLVRAARHYEGGNQILIRLAVMTAREFIATQPGESPPMNKWVRASCPGRMDVSGGWSDTPPITYEHGGAVVDAAIRIDGKKPTVARARKIPEPHLVLVLGSDREHSVQIVCKELSDCSDYANPRSSGALLKAAVHCAEVISLPSCESLQEQLMRKYGGGIELNTWSDLPQGSGLGTSSILAGAAIAVLWRISGKTYDNSSLIHAVLLVEQMLTTGGGWQDQVGGLTPGLNIGHSEAKFPLKVDITPIPLSEEIQRKFNEHFLLVYTGKTRLARNLLQDVVRNWYARSPYIVENCDNLTKTAWECKKAFEEGDFEKVGACMNTYWSQKKVMAPGSEPLVVQRMMAALQAHVYGQCLAGAGGGGFMYVLTKEPNAIDKVTEILSSLEGAHEFTVHSVELDGAGIEVVMED
ncbi:L-fucose kinase-like [Acanthaster planci]|uniref:L-fucose kinase-like n=1 Tax=Acanthaster planci TaxID=133434 RepID=A0A8B7XSX2_ACAPL|nr:L-fucose kinase-like [Acanthaster planci]XP_022083959.1 L-fucose kinase-like [Acanthaster planci]